MDYESAISQVDLLNIKLSMLSTKLQSKRLQHEEIKQVYEEKICWYLKREMQLKLAYDRQKKQIIELEKKLAKYEDQNRLQFYPNPSSSFNNHTKSPSINNNSIFLSIPSPQSTSKISYNNNSPTAINQNVINSGGKSAAKPDSASKKIKSQSQTPGQSQRSKSSQIFKVEQKIQITSPSVGLMNYENDDENDGLLHALSPIIDKLKVHMEGQQANYLQVQNFARKANLKLSIENVKCVKHPEEAAGNDDDLEIDVDLDELNTPVKYSCTSSACCLKNEANIAQLLEILKNCASVTTPFASPMQSPLIPPPQSRVTSNSKAADLNHSSASTVMVNNGGCSPLSPGAEIRMSMKKEMPMSAVSVEKEKEKSPEQFEVQALDSSALSLSLLNSTTNSRRSTMDIGLFQKVCAERVNSVPKGTGYMEPDFGTSAGVSRDSSSGKGNVVISSLPVVMSHSPVVRTYKQIFINEES